MTKTQDTVDPVGKLLNLELLSKDQKYLGYYKQLFKNGGCLDSGTSLHMKDVLIADEQHTKIMRDAYSDDHPTLTERTLVNIVYDAAGPGTYLQDYLQSLSLTRTGKIILIPAYGAADASVMSEGSEFPETTIDYEEQVHAQIVKVGSSFKVTNEQVKHDDFDVVRRNTESLSRALSRRKEKKVYEAMITNGTVVFDNLDTAVRTTSGRNSSGAKNGTITVTDIADVQDTLLSQGFVPDTIIIHPRAWMMFLEPRMATAFGLNRDVSWTSEGLPDGSGSNPTRLATPSNGFPSSWNIVVTTAVDYFAPANARINAMTDIMVCDSKAMGLIVDTGSGVKINTYTDPMRDLIKVTGRELYGISILHNGEAIGLLKNVAIAPNIDFSTQVVATIPQTGVTPTYLSLTGDRIDTSIYTGAY